MITTTRSHVLHTLWHLLDKSIANYTTVQCQKWKSAMTSSWSWPDFEFWHVGEAILSWSFDLSPRNLILLMDLYIYALTYIYVYIILSPAATARTTDTSHPAQLQKPADKPFCMGSRRLGMEPFHIIHGETLGKLRAFVAPGQHQEGVLVCTVPHNSCIVICTAGQGCWENDMPLPSSFLKCFNYWISSVYSQLRSILQDKNKSVKISLKIKNSSEKHL